MRMRQHRGHRLTQSRDAGSASVSSSPARKTEGREGEVSKEVESNVRPTSPPFPGCPQEGAAGQRAGSLGMRGGSARRDAGERWSPFCSPSRTALTSCVCSKGTPHPARTARSRGLYLSRVLKDWMMSLACTHRKYTWPETGEEEKDASAGNRHRVRTCPKLRNSRERCGECWGHP